MNGWKKRKTSTLAAVKNLPSWWRKPRKREA